LGKGFEFVRDILELNLDKLLGGVDAVFHQAAIAGVRSSWGRVRQYVRNNILDAAPPRGLQGQAA
jgi:nucleoside-diphosphate-sugar epimerase